MLLIKAYQMNFKDVARLEKRIQKIQFEKVPPTLRMLVVNPNENVPDFVDEWTMVVNIEGKN